MGAIMLSVFTDEISDDFEHACQVAVEWELEWVELRKLWGKNIMAMNGREIAEARKILSEKGLRVSQIGSPLFKCTWPVGGAAGGKRDKFSDDYTFEQQPELLERGIELCKAFSCQRLRCFDFWRLDEAERAQERAGMNARLREAAAIAGKSGIILSMENEYACNTATAKEGAEVLKAVPGRSFGLNFDPGNSVFASEKPFPEGYALIPRGRITNVHCKDAFLDEKGKPQWQAVGKGTIDWVGLFARLKKDGYRGPVTLETHWRGAGSPEASSRESMAGLKAALAQAGLV